MLPYSSFLPEEERGRVQDHLITRSRLFSRSRGLAQSALARGARPPPSAVCGGALRPSRGGGPGAPHMGRPPAFVGWARAEASGHVGGRGRFTMRAACRGRFPYLGADGSSRIHHCFKLRSRKAISDQSWKPTRYDPKRFSLGAQLAALGLPPLRVVLGVVLQAPRRVCRLACPPAGRPRGRVVVSPTGQAGA